MLLFWPAWWKHVWGFVQQDCKVGARLKTTTRRIFTWFPSKASVLVVMRKLVINHCSICISSTAVIIIAVDWISYLTTGQSREKFFNGLFISLLSCCKYRCTCQKGQNNNSCSLFMCSKSFLAWGISLIGFVAICWLKCHIVLISAANLAFRNS